MSHYKTGHKQPRFRYSVLARCVAWANISVQVLFPLAVTFTPVMAARAQHAVQPRLSMGNTTVTADNNVEKNVASFAANAGTFLSSQPDSDATRNFITGMATAKANQEIQEWLGKYGTARVKLNVDKDFSLKDSSLEMLYPIYDTPTNMLFTQGAIHRTDDRTQSNIGFGWRHFSGNDWMAGVNTFIDHDLSRSHTRIGVGAEYWRDYLKLSANGYIRASGWKKSPDIEDYQERPANGWDIRAEGYLPAWPQLGASLMYEQYYGDEVGLFGKDKRQKDPHAISAEVTYTPVPLLTLSAGHKQGKSGENDTRFGLEVNYRIGEPLAKQLDTDSIRERRVLAGSRYDLVERNNNIVLEYRKSEVIRIALPERIEGKGGQTLSLGLVVSKATHGLKNVQWEAPSLLAEGGKITGQGSQWQVTLPAYRPGKDNYYAISAVAYDNKGNASKRVQTEVVITGAGMSADRTALTLDGQKPDAPVFSGAASTGSERPSAGNWTEKGNGVYVATLTLGSAAGQLSVMPRVNGQNAVAQPLVLNVAGDASKAEIRDMTVKVNNQLANGQSANQITLTVVDSYGNPLQGQEVTLTLPQGVTSKTGNTVTTNAAGKVDIELMSTVAGEHSITASVNNAQKTVTVKFKADFSTGQATLEVDGSTPKVANDNDAFTLTATVKDQYGNLLPGAVVVFNLPRGVKPLADGNIMVNADKEGKAELKVVSVTAGTYEITASAGNDQPSNAQSVTFVADKTTATISSIEVIGNRAVADGKTKQTYKVTVTDANNNLLKDSDVTLTASSENLVLDPKGTAKTNEQGQAVFTGSTTIAATYTLTAKVEQANGQVSTKTAESKFVADDKNAVLAASPERVDSLVADGKTTATMTVTLMAGVNPVGGSMWVDIEAPEGVTEKDYQFLPSKADHFSGGKITRTFSTSKPGVYTFTFNALTYGGYEMTPVKVTINAVAAETENGEEEMP
ncbi:inverse autotransporter beta domain-containing protein [Escherichia coli]|nr:inverse autotransporter beta domain-containing protein [Escherichia coli]EIN4256437.1 inverse autotransporter beta domain-containing protein [Escherichia coli]HCC7244018.1 inverse autotransporter beta domain-containing protein [Escherichia coli O141:H32]